MGNKMLKNGGWRGAGEFVSIRKTVETKSGPVQVCSYTCQQDQTGEKRTRAYFELRSANRVVMLPPAVKTLSAAIVEAGRIFG
ncbi:MAG: hypothetical protein WCR92_09260 [Candidatus Cloacimonadaceae bacterium]|jgi:hypothetical protein